MITASKLRVNKSELCVHCNREVRRLIDLRINSISLSFCEDCSNAISRVITSSLSLDLVSQYDKDEYYVIED